MSGHGTSSAAPQGHLEKWRWAYLVVGSGLLLLTVAIHNYAPQLDAAGLWYQKGFTIGLYAGIGSAVFFAIGTHPLLWEFLKGPFKLLWWLASAGDRTSPHPSGRVVSAYADQQGQVWVVWENGVVARARYEPPSW